MNNLPVYEELDQAIDQMLGGADAVNRSGGPEMAGLLAVASELRDLPRDNFKTRLRLELEWEAAGRTVSVAEAQPAFAKLGPANTESLPSLFGKVWSGYPVRRSNMALSFALHAIMVLAVGAGFVAVKSMKPQIDTHPYVSVHLQPYEFPVGSNESHGGGSGGAQEKIRASKGVAPRSAREQLAPPVVLQNQVPKLPTLATVIAPEMALPKSREVGDPLSALRLASNGPGAGGGFGGNAGGGVGTGWDSGRGSGRNGGCCDGLYAIGNGVSMPKPIFAPEPEFSEEARRVKLQGEVTLLGTIGADGLPRNLRVVRSLGMGLDEKAMETVKTWRFEPARMNGRPVAVQMNIIVNFHLY